jgi:hypothetical protein
MKYAVVVLLLLIPFVLAHESENQTHIQEHQELSSDGAYAQTNSFDSVNPFLLVSQQQYGQALFAAIIWFGLLAGLWQLVKLVLGRLLIIQE